ncbi:zona pellucida-like domain-containing protein 1 [Nothobranchius furzeri]|uniref:Zona pellucida-like domain-containing protein 1 n=1 Tax=Nothobranchius furzeri TaxID=105023 RepID=A0A9D3BQM4_NOTFU|nr:zona pellucida-like domain-containing protein 1 [Nothobranchius furzeri]
MVLGVLPTIKVILLTQLCDKHQLRYQRGITEVREPSSERMSLSLCLPLLAVLLQPALCLYNCSSVYNRNPDNSDMTVGCGTTIITVDVNACTAQWAGFNASELVLGGNHDHTDCLGSIDTSLDPPVVRFHLPVNSSQDNPCHQSLQIVDEAPDPTGPFSNFLSIQSVVITGYIQTLQSDVGIISYSTDLYYQFSCRYPLEYLLNNTRIAASSISVATTTNNGTFINALRMSIFNDSDYKYPLVMPSKGIELRTKVYVAVKTVNLTGNFYVLLDRCFATPSPYNSSQTVAYTFFTGCTVDTKTAVTLNGLSATAEFNFEAFRFVQDRAQEISTIYLHCMLRLCEPSSCQQLTSVCKNKRKRSLTPFGEQSSDTATISVGPLYTAAEAAFFNFYLGSNLASSTDKFTITGLLVGVVSARLVIGFP